MPSRGLEGVWEMPSQHVTLTVLASLTQGLGTGLLSSEQAGQPYFSVSDSGSCYLAQVD